MSVPSAYLSAREWRRWGIVNGLTSGLLIWVNNTERTNARTPEGDPQPICGKRHFAAEEPPGDFRACR